jgi:signal transduction histidine kinase
MRILSDSMLLRLGLAIIAVALAVPLTLLFQPLQQAPYALFFAAVVVSAWCAGCWAALLATALSAVALDLFFLAPLFALGTDQADGIRLGAFLFAGGLTALLEATRTRLEDSLRQRARLGRESLARIAHELRNFLAPVAAAARVLRGHDMRGVAAERSLEILERKVQQMGRLINDLVDTARLEQGKLRLCKEPVDLAMAASHAIEAARSFLEARDHTVSLQGPPGALYLDADPMRLEQILINLLINAAKYTDPGGRITVKLEPAPGAVLLRVRDTGAGIPPEKLEHVFELFEQIGQGSPDGLGVGLSLARGLARLHGGDVTVRSDGPGMGSEFVVHLPPSPTNERQNAGPQESRARTPRP